jgi:choline-glycine betaine transporter
MGSKGVFFLFLIYITVKYGNVKLGQKDEPPEFSTAAYFSMIFAAGVAVGLFVFGVAEPLFYLDSHFYANPGYRSEDEIAMFAINLTVTNWGVNGWAPYLIVAVCMALAGFRFKLPMTFRSCFYPILGDYTWGWVGDLIDGASIVVTVAGVCTSLGLGAIQVRRTWCRERHVRTNLCRNSPFCLSFFFSLTLLIGRLWLDSR